MSSTANAAGNGLPHLGIRWDINREDESLVTISVQVNGVVVESFLLPYGWRADNDMCPLLFSLSWLEDYYAFSEYKRRDEYGNRFERYMLARREAERLNPPPQQEEEDFGE